MVPLSSVGLVTSRVQQLLAATTATMLDLHTTAKTRMTAADTEGWCQLCLAVRNILLPYIQVKVLRSQNATACRSSAMIQVALNAVFPPDKIQSVTGVKNVGTICNLDTETILKPISGFVPKDQPVEEIKVPEEFVKERMEEISVAIDQADVEENQTEDSNVEGNEIDSIDADAGESEKAEMEENPVKDGKEDSEE